MFPTSDQKTLGQIKVTTHFPQEPLIRQTPHQTGLWKDSQFNLDQPTDECDYWVVLDGLKKTEQAFCRSGRTVFVTMEPPGAKTYCTAFLRQFDLVITSHRDFKHPHVRHTCQGPLWHMGIVREAFGGVGDGNYKAALDYDALRSMPVPEKSQLLSVISSNKKYLKGHRTRLAFVETLKEAFGDSIAVFGRNIRSMKDKIEAIAPFKYHIALENTVAPDYWTEKLADAYLGFAHPIYSGCPRIENYFDSRSLTRIDISRPAEAIEIIKNTIAANTYERNFEHLLAARKLVLDKYNTFEVMREACASLPPGEPRRIIFKTNEDLEGWNPRKTYRKARDKMRRLISSVAKTN